MHRAYVHNQQHHSMQYRLFLEWDSRFMDDDNPQYPKDSITPEPIIH